MNDKIARAICQIGRHTVLAMNDPEVEPGHQRIGVTPDDISGVSLLFALTGNEGVLYGWMKQTRLDDGRTATFVPHDDIADQRLVQLVDLAAELRFTAPDMIQLRLVGVEDD